VARARHRPRAAVEAERGWRRRRRAGATQR
jgi:hypothetical protein